MAFSDAKSPFKSLTVWGSLLSFGSCLETLNQALQLVPVEALPPQAGAVVTAAVGISGAILSIIGRVKASQKLKL